MILRSAKGWIAERRTLVKRRLDRLGHYLTETADQPDQGWTDDPGEATTQTAGEGRTDTTSEHEEQQ